MASRRPQDLAETLALLVWTARVIEDAGLTADPAHLAAIVAMAPVVRPLRLGDGDGAVPWRDGGRRCRARHRAGGAAAGDAGAPGLPMGYARLAGGRVALVMDGGRRRRAGIWRRWPSR